MAWGSWDKSGNNWFRVGTSTSISGRRVTVRYKIQSRYNPVNDDQTMNLDGKYSGGQIINFHNGGGTITVATRSWTGSYGSTYTIGCHAYGIYNGATPSHSERVTIPAKEPGRVSRPRVTSINNNGGIARWSAPASNGARINRYEVSWHTSSSGLGQIYRSGGGARSQSNRGRHGNTTYYVKVRAHNSAGWGGWSPPRGFTTKSDRPAAPTNVQANYVTDTKAKVTWTHHGTSTAPYGSQRVQLKYTQTDGSWSSWITVATVGKSARSWTGADIMAPGAQHRYRVQAINETGSAVSGESRTIRSRPLPPGTPVAGKRSNGDISVSWPSGNRYNDYIDYQLEDNPDGSGWVVLASELGSRSWVHESPDPSKTHQYRVRVRDTYRSANRYSGWSSASNTVQLQAPPAAPELLGPSGVLDRDQETVLRWEHVSVDTTDQTEWEIRWRFQGDSSWTTASGTGQGSEHSLGTLGTSGIIEWQARTRGADPEFGPWASVSTFELASVPYATVSEPNEDPHRASEVTLAWSYANDDSAQQSGWRVELRDAVGDILESDNGSGDRAQYKFRTYLDDDTDYSVRVQVRASTGLWSEWDEFAFTTAFPLPVAMSPLLLWDDPSGSVAISFDQVSNPGEYAWTGPEEISTSTYTWDTGQRTNYAINPSFEAQQLGWTASGATLDRVLAEDVDGGERASRDHLMSVTFDGSAAEVLAQQDEPGWVAVTEDQWIAVSALLGGEFTGSYTGNTGLALRVTYRDDTGAEVSHADSSVELYPQPSRITLADQVPASATQAQVGIWATSGDSEELLGEGEGFWADAVMVALGSTEEDAWQVASVYFDGALGTTTEVEVVDVQRRAGENGRWVTIGQSLDPLTSITDTIPPVSGLACYRIISRTSLPSSRVGETHCLMIHDASLPYRVPVPESVAVDQEIDTLGFWLNSGNGYQDWVRAFLDLEVQDSSLGKPNRVLHRFSGQQYPRPFSGKNRAWEISLKFTVFEHEGDLPPFGYSSTRGEWVDTSFAGDPFWYRDVKGRRFQCSISDLKMAESGSAGVYEVSLTVTRTEEESQLLEDEQ